jgi:hypothetical protein
VETQGWESLNEDGIERMIGLAGLLLIVIDLWALWHCWSRSLATGPKLMWSVTILIFPVLGPILYALFGRAAAV